jgi:hypothetical protein
MGNSKIRKTGLGGFWFRKSVALPLIIALAGAIAGTASPQDQPPPASSAQQEEATGDVQKTRVLQLPKGSYVEVLLNDGQTVEGRLGDVVGEGFMLQTVSNNRLADRLVRFEEMQSVASPGGPEPRGDTVELTLDHGKVTVGLVGRGISLDLTLYTPAKIVQNVAAHATLPVKLPEKSRHSDRGGQ